MAVTIYRGSQSINISKSAWNLFSTCQLRYRWEKIDRRSPDFEDDVGEAALLGEAGHEALVAILSEGCDPRSDPDAAASAVGEVLAGYLIDDIKRAQLIDACLDAGSWAFSRCGEFRHIEQLLSMQRMQGVTAWGMFDVAIANGTAAPLEVVDWTFGRPRFDTEEEFRFAMGTGIYRLIAGHIEPDLRPIAITEVRLLPRLSATTVILSDEETRQAWDQLRSAADQIQAAIDAQDFPPTPGSHCSYCPYRASCPAVRYDSDEVPL